MPKAPSVWNDGSQQRPAPPRAGACLTLLLASTPLLLAGCSGAGKPGPADQPFEGRLNSALEISNSATRDTALATVAKDAADAGAAYTVKKTVAAIANSATKDGTASTAAVKLAEIGQASDAREVAMMIGNSATRDTTLAKIAATGEKKKSAPDGKGADDGEKH